MNGQKIIKTIIKGMVTVLVLFLTIGLNTLKTFGVVNDNPFSIASIAVYPMMLAFIVGIIFNIWRIEKFKKVSDIVFCIKDKDCRTILFEDIIDYIKNDKKNGIFYAQKMMKNIIILIMFFGGIAFYLIPSIEAPLMTVLIIYGAIYVVKDTYKRFSFVFAMA